MTATVLMVAEKPSIAETIAKAFAGGGAHFRKGKVPVYEYEGNFKGQRALFRVTSVVGHVFSLDFAPQYRGWDKTDPKELFDAPTQKEEANPKAHIVAHLRGEAKGCSHLVLWLDCDREGENICFEVMQCLHFSRSQVLRAHFSSLVPEDLRRSMANLGVPNEDEALAVDARQEIDLKCGVAFTRFQTKFFQGRYGNLDARLISYGPCQTPTLGFTVERHDLIQSFKPEKFWKICPSLSVSDGRVLEPEWERGRVFDQAVATTFLQLLKGGKGAKAEVKSVSRKKESRVRPVPLNTVEMLKLASKQLGMGPHETMQVAERLYTSGYISYPRTETSKYPAGFDTRPVLQEQSRHGYWGDTVREVLASGVGKAKSSGVDAGDHPPITPTACVEEGTLTGSSWRLYDLVARHFIATLMPDASYTKTKVTFVIRPTVEGAGDLGGGEVFTIVGRSDFSPGFTSILPWMAVEMTPLPPNISEGQVFPVNDVALREGSTSPPDYLTESELIDKMEKHGIGTDASIPVHINNILERNYARLETGRKIVPTNLGVVLVHGYHKIDSELVLPKVRAHIGVYAHAGGVKA